MQGAGQQADLDAIRAGQDARMALETGDRQCGGRQRDRQVGEFSKGMARRIGLAQALINDPDLVILDEPTSGLDPIGCRQVKDLIQALAKRGKTILLSSHLLADVEDVCDRVAILYNGRVQALGTINELLEQRQQYRLTMPELPVEAMQRILAAVRAELGSEPVLDHPRRDLEQFFLEIVEKARQATTEASGVGPAAGVARYLAGADKLQQLVTPTASELAAPPTADEKRQADEKLRRLLDSSKP